MRRRYGSLCFRDFLPVWLGMAVLLYVLAGSLIQRLPLFSVVPAVVLGYLLLGVILPLREKFAIEKDEIISRKGRRKENISLPDELLLVVSWASVPALFGEKDYFLKRKCALSLLEYMEPGEFLEELHGEKGFRYTNTSLERQFRYRWIYSFILDEEALKKVIRERKCCIVLPESLRGRMDLEGLDAEIYVDVGY